MEHKNLDYKKTGLPESELMDSLYSLAQGVWQDREMGTDMEWEGHVLWAADRIKRIHAEYPEMTEEAMTAVMLRNLPADIPLGIVRTRCVVYQRNPDTVTDVLFSYDQRFPFVEGQSQEVRNIRMAEEIIALETGIKKPFPGDLQFIEGCDLGNPPLQKRLEDTLRQSLAGKIPAPTLKIF